MAHWYADTKEGTWPENETLEELKAGIVAHFADGYAGPDESATPPEFTEVGFWDDDDHQTVMDAAQLKQFNADIENDFEAAIEGWDAPSDYEEHNTHWGL